jgi:hypothetical protein
VTFVHQGARERNLPTALRSGAKLEQIREAAHAHVLHNFNRKKNLKLLADALLSHIAPQYEITSDENPILQQVQLSI